MAWEPQLTEEVVFLARLLLAQSAIKDCDCDCHCNCLVIEKVEMTVHKTVITTRNKAYELHCWRV